MITLEVNGKQGIFQLNLPTVLSGITKEYIDAVTSHIKVDANYTVVGIVFKEKLSTLAFAAKKNKKDSNIAVIPIFVKAGETDSKFINELTTCDKLIIAPSDIMMGHHLSTPRNLLTINTILDIIEGDNEIFNKLIGLDEQCYFIEFKLIPNCSIHGAYENINSGFENPFVTKLGEAKQNNIILPNTPKILV